MSTAASTLIWDLGNTVTTSGTPGVNPIIPTFTLPGIYNISLTAISSIGCTNTKVSTVTVFSNIIPDASVTAACFKETITFTDLSQVEYPDGSVIISRNWNFGNGSSFTTSSPTIVGGYPVLGTYTITIRATTGKCTASKSFPYSMFHHYISK